MENKDVEGKVKWFSEEKKYGFITDNDNLDHYFHYDQVLESKDIGIGDKVIFNGYFFRDGYRAKKIRVIEKANNDKIKCKNCNQEIIPKIITGEVIRGRLYDVIPKYIACPVCSHVFEEIKDENNYKRNTLLSSIYLIFFLLFISTSIGIYAYIHF